ncbi:hypothetical protein P7C70_g2218, partial [Phenoliferia sp. Uapishka_3]
MSSWSSFPFSELPLELREHIVALVCMQDHARRTRLQVGVADRELFEDYNSQFDSPTPNHERRRAAAAIPRFPSLAAIRLVNKELSRFGGMQMFASFSARRCSDVVFQQYIGPNYAKFANHIKICYNSNPDYILPFLTGTRHLNSLDLDNTALIERFPEGWLVNGSSATSAFSSEFASSYAGFIDAAKHVKAVKFGDDWGPVEIIKTLKLFPSLRSFSLHRDQLELPEEDDAEREREHADLLKAAQSATNLVALGITSELWGSRLSYKEHWRLVESVADRLEVLELEYEDFDNLDGSSARVTFPKLRKLIIHCTHGIYAIRDQLKGSPITDITCGVSGGRDLDKILEAFPGLQRLNVTQSGHPEWDVQGLYDIASTCAEKGIALHIRCSTFPSLHISDLLHDRPATHEAAKEALNFAAKKRTVAFRNLRRRRLELDRGAGDTSAPEKLTLESLEELRLDWMD